MPTQVDHSRPVRTVDTNGKIVSTDTNNAAPMKSLDYVGRTIETQSQNVAQAAKEDATKVAETAANAVFGNNEEAKPAEAKSTEEAKPEEAQAAEKEVTNADVRKAYLEAERVKRKALEMEKKAKDNLAKAEAFEKAKSMAESGEDPTALLKAAGLDPIKFYRDMTTYALSDRGKPEDPVQKQLREHEERLKKYQEDLENQAKAIKEKEELTAKNQVIMDKVIPILQNNQEKYETLLLEYGANAAIAVFQKVWDHYEETGQVKSFEEAADEMENYWASRVESGLSAALKLKKFQNKYTQANSGTQETKQDQLETPKRSVTLSNKQSVTPVPAAQPSRKNMTRDERIADILKRHGG